MTQPQSLFIQVNSYNPTQLQAHLEHVYQEHRNSGEEDYIYNVVLVNPAQNGVLQSQRLDIIRPYLPGGAKQAFDNVFVGTQELPYTGVNMTLPPWQRYSAYAAGILDGNFRWRNLVEQKRNWQAFAGWYGQPFHFYIGYEAVLTWWTNPDLASAYEAYHIQSIWDAESIAAGRAILWSPSLWDRWTWLTAGQKNTILAQLDSVWAGQQAYTGRDINWLHPQDARGTTSAWGSAAIQANDVQGWFQDIGNLQLVESFRVNMEMFKQDQNGSMWALSSADFAARMQEYANLPIGASWEMRWWMPGHVDVENILSTLHGSATTQRADNTKWANREEVRKFLTTGELTGQYANRAYVTGQLHEVFEAMGLEVQGQYYMRPYDPNPPSGRAVNSDHLTAGALDIFFRTSGDRELLGTVRRILDDLVRRNIVRYYIDLGANAAHWDHIHASLQLGVY